jgi:hypothetical protein
MKIEVFKDILNRIRKSDAVVNVLYPKVDLTNITDEYVNIIEMLMKCYYGEEAADNIGWFLYEKAGREDFKAFDKDGSEILKDEDELWADCEELKMSKKDYIPPPLMTDEQRAELMEEMKKAFLQL